MPVLNQVILVNPELSHPCIYKQEGPQVLADEEMLFKTNLFLALAAKFFIETVCAIW